jgi:two-component system, chemotaxis family, protein-glutamate methylesterase/glutaminase
VKKPVRVLIVDDSALVREILSQGLGADPGIEVVGTAGDPYQARDKIVALGPDVLTLDVEMPRMDGVEFLRRLMPQHPLPVVMVSSLTERGAQITLDAMEAGAVDFVAKPRADLARGLSLMMEELRSKVRAAAAANVRHLKKRVGLPKNRPPLIRSLAEMTDKVIAIGASTGGTEAIRSVVTQLPANCPGIVIVQHMPAGFTRMFAERLKSLCAMDVKEAADGDRVVSGRILVAPGGYHLRIKRLGGEYIAQIRTGEPINGHCPSVEALFDSIAVNVGNNAVGLMLTGMGADGADALRRMRDAGARCFAQDQESSVVFGMPKEAFSRGGAERLVSLGEIPAVILAALSRGK